MHTLQQLLGKTVRKFGLQSDVKAAGLFLLTERWLQEQDLRPDDYECIEFSRDTLQIACAHSIAAQELHIRKESLQLYLQENANDHPNVLVQVVRTRKVGKNA